MDQAETMIISKGDQEIPIQVPIEFKTNFEAKHGIGSLEKLLIRFAQDCHTFVSIGKEFGISRERIRKIHVQLFSPVTDKKTGTMRKRSCTVARRIKKNRFPKHVLWVWREAKKRGCEVKHLITEKVYINQKFILINDKKCKIHLLTNIFILPRTVNARYAHSQIRRVTLAETDAQIFVLWPIGGKQKYFIVPSIDLLKYFDLRSIDKLSIYLPLEKIPVYKNIKPKIDWWQYENAWHLLEQRS